MLVWRYLAIAACHHKNSKTQVFVFSDSYVTASTAQALHQRKR